MLWPLLADTPQFNRAIGLPPMHYKAEPLPGGGSAVTVSYHLLGIPFVRWREHPFDWEENRYYSVLREFHWGPIASTRGGVELKPDGDGTDLLIFGEFVPRN